MIGLTILIRVLTCQLLRRFCLSVSLFAMRLFHVSRFSEQKEVNVSQLVLCIKIELVSEDSSTVTDVRQPSPQPVETVKPVETPPSPPVKPQPEVMIKPAPTPSPTVVTPGICSG